MSEEPFGTEDLGLASLLYAKGVRYNGVRSRDASRWQKEMCFEQPDPALLTGWQAGTVEVSAQAYWRASRFLKHALKQMTERR